MISAGGPRRRDSTLWGLRSGNGVATRRRARLDVRSIGKRAMRAQAIVHEKPARAAAESQTPNGASGRTTRQPAEMGRVAVRSRGGIERRRQATGGRAQSGSFVGEGRIAEGSVAA
ncbi:MAG: hypothetical protein ACT4P6_07855 [Gemmatimonadaceae bacterium]